MKLKPYCARKQEWTSVGRLGFIVGGPNGQASECKICQISDSQICLDVGLSRVPRLFVLMLTPQSKVRRACLVQWRSGHLLRAKFLSAREIRRYSADAQIVN
jgi:hypothetical protein